MSTVNRLIGDQSAGSPDAMYDQLDPVGQQIFPLGDSWTYDSHLAPGLYLSDPQGHALLVGTNARAMTLLDFGPAIADIGSVEIRSPELLDQLGDRLKVMAQRMRERRADRRLAEENTGLTDSWREWP